MNILKDKIANLTIGEFVDMAATCSTFLNALASEFASFEKQDKAMVVLAVAFPIMGLNDAMARLYDSLANDLPKGAIEVNPSKSQS